MTKKLTNQQLVAIWLKAKERNYAYLARHCNIQNSLLTAFKQGKPLRPEYLLRIAEFTGLDLRIAGLKNAKI